MSKTTATDPDPCGYEAADFVIVTALEKEAQAVVRRLEDHAVRRFEEQDIRTYHCGTIPIHDTERAYRVVVLLPSMGEVAAGTAVTDAIVRWNPRFVLMVGIAGGIPQDDLDLGDVVVADQIVGYKYGKVTDEGIQPRDRVYPVSALLLDRVRSFWDDSWTGEVNVPRPNNAARPVSKHFIGPVASGNKVIASTEFRQRLKARWPKLTALEMDGEGVFGAVFDRPHCQPRRHALVRGGLPSRIHPPAPGLRRSGEGAGEPGPGEGHDRGHGLPPPGSGGGGVGAGVRITDPLSTLNALRPSVASFNSAVRWFWIRAFRPFRALRGSNTLRSP
jgi:nucleoside phosphorylase